MRAKFKFLSLICLTFLLGSVCQSATIKGTVKGPDGAPFQAAFVQALNTKTKMLVSVLSDTQGRYTIGNLPAGEYRVQIRAVGYNADAHNGVNLTADQNTSFDFALQKGTVRWSDITFYQGMQLFPAGRGKDLIVEYCSVCHEFQTRIASVRRDADGWKDGVEYMRDTLHYANSRVTDKDAEDIAAYLDSLFGTEGSVLPKSPEDIPAYKSLVRPVSRDALNIVYVEYEMTGPSRFPFSATPDKDGYMWIPNAGIGNRITRLDPKTGEMTDFLVPAGPTAGVHSAIPTPAGDVWFAEQGRNNLGFWDHKTQQIIEYHDAYLPGKEGISPGGEKHTLRIDASGNVWASGEPLTKFDPETKRFTRFEGVSAYDVKVDKDGNAWFASPVQNKIGMVDGKTMKMTQWESPTPKSGPRRIEFGHDGMVYSGEFSGGNMLQFNPKTQAFKEFPLPGPDPSPYGMGVDTDGNIWYDSHHMDIIGCFNPQTGKTVEYPFPQAELAIREFFLDAQGRLWFGTAPNNKVGYFYLAGKNSGK